MIRFLGPIIVILVTSLLVCPSSMAKGVSEIRGGVGFVMNGAKPSLEDSSMNLASKNLLGASVSLQTSLRHWLLVNISIEYGKYQFFRRSQGGLAVTEVGKRFHVPILLRVPFLRYFSVGLGFYGSYRIGSVETSNSFSVGEKTSAFDSGEHGLEAALGIQVPLIRTGYWILVDYRHLYSVTSRPDENRHWDKVIFGFLTRI